jgi:hypothetical protein
MAPLSGTSDREPLVSVPMDRMAIVGCGGSGGELPWVRTQGISTHLGPFAGLFGEHGADGADQGIAAGKDAHDGGAPADLAVEAFGLLDQICRGCPRGHDWRGAHRQVR